MERVQRTFDFPNDYESVARFLSDCYEPLNRDGNWIRPIWDWTCFHPQTEPESLGRMGLWVDGEEVVGATVFDCRISDVCLCAKKEYKVLKGEMLRYAEGSLSEADSGGTRQLNVFAHDFDASLEELLHQSGYRRRPEADRTFCCYEVPTSPAASVLPEGFSFMTLEQENDLRKVHSVLHRGFDHPGEPPDGEIEDRKKMQSCPNFRFDLTTVVKAPSGDYAAYCGMWIDEAGRYCYVEPVATDPTYRGRGLGKAAVLDGLRRCRDLGAEVAYVWSDTCFYRSIGFRPLNEHHCWRKTF